MQSEDWTLNHAHASRVLALYFKREFSFRKTITASLNSFGLSIIRKWPTPSHIFD